MTKIMIQMIATELLRRAEGYIIAAVLIGAAIAGMLIPGMWWSDTPIHNVGDTREIVEVVEEEPTGWLPSGAIPGMNHVNHCMVQCDGM
jgi:hypothetical protein